MMNFWELLCSARGGAPVLDLWTVGTASWLRRPPLEPFSETAAFPLVNLLVQPGAFSS